MGLQETEAIPTVFPFPGNPVSNMGVNIKPGFTDLASISGSTITKERYEPITKNTLSDVRLLPAITEAAYKAAEKQEEERVRSQFKTAIDEAKARNNETESAEPPETFFFGTVKGKPREIPWTMILIGSALVLVLLSGR